DTGSLTLGTILGLSAVLLKQEVLLIIIGGMFVLETCSVLIQVIGYKITGKRIFKIAPLHHHFEAKGWTETKIVIRFWIIEILFVLFALSTLKIR
ncbi:phospho-N-acetylmuramoyl-pentapeptide-transferase, partial [candidate division TA06 bacterium]